jgi:DNA mismatch repair protein MutL
MTINTCYNSYVSIHLLPPEIASQIAAGEVIERPASVVKELLENSLDAGARNIVISIDGAGKQLIEVADDGSGIPKDELELSVSRHATSKLSSAEDLFRISTLGFRGEALASIASISRLSITSRVTESDVGAQLRVEGGRAGNVETVGAPVGTLVRVEGLFFNVPARLKFLKKDATERRHIDTLVTRYSLAYPSVRFSLNHSGRAVLQTSGNGDRREVLASSYGVDVGRQMIEVLSEDENLSITGFISPTSLTRSNRREIIFFVNGRPVQDFALSTALVQAYRTMLMVGRYPMATLFLELPPDSVDVNVHPTKAEVRFKDTDIVFRGIQRGARRALLAHTPVPELGNQLRWSPESTQSTWSQDLDPTWHTSSGTQAEGFEQEESGLSIPSIQQTLQSKSVPLLRLVGQLATTYIVAEGPDGLYLIDQHAAHERVLYERFMAQYEKSGKEKDEEESIPSQTLLEPVVVEFSQINAQLIEEQIPILSKLGFHIEPFGRETYMLRSIPDVLSGMEPSAALNVLFEDFEEDETPLLAEIEKRVIARVCKRAAVKAGQILSKEEQQALLIDLENCQSPRTCPHGRPTMIHLSVDLLERQFGRRGAV